MTKVNQILMGATFFCPLIVCAQILSVNECIECLNHAWCKLGNCHEYMTRPPSDYVVCVLNAF